MSPTIVLAPLFKESSEEWNGAIILSAWLDQLGTDLSIASAGAASILDGPDAALTISNEAVNTADYVSRIRGTTHPAGEVVTYTVAGGTRGVRYFVKFPFTTADGQSPVVVQPFSII
jgi:hypothetical protein